RRGESRQPAGVMAFVVSGGAAALDELLGRPPALERNGELLEGVDRGGLEVGHGCEAASERTWAASVTGLDALCANKRAATFGTRLALVARSSAAHQTPAVRRGGQR